MMMKQNFNNMQFINHIVTYILAGILVLECRSVWMSVPDSNFNLFLLVGLFITTFIRIVTMPLSIKGLRIASFVSLFVISVGVIWYIATSYNIAGLAKFIVSVVLLVFNYFATIEQNRRDLLIKYKNIILCISFISLFFWFFGTQLGIINRTGTITSTWVSKLNQSFTTFPNYYNLYFETQGISIFGKHFIRNTAIFTEAPMASFHFSIALLVEVFFYKPPRLWVILLFSLTILTSFSTTGMVLLVIVAFYLIMTFKKSTVVIQLVKLLLLPLSFIVGLFLITYLLNTRLDTVGSGQIRIDDFIIGFKTWLERPVFGYGYGNVAPLTAKMGMWRIWNRGFSNSVMTILAQGGVLIFSVYILPIFKGITNMIVQKSMNQLLFTILFLYLYAVTITTYNYLPILIILFIWDSNSWNIYESSRV